MISSRSNCSYGFKRNEGLGALSGSIVVWMKNGFFDKEVGCFICVHGRKGHGFTGMNRVVI